MEDKKIISIKCESCGAPLEVEKGKPIGYCQYCGAKYDVSALVNDDKDVELAKINYQAYKETEELKQQYELEKIKQEREWQEKQQNIAESKEKATSFKKSKLRIVIIVFLIIFIVGAVIAFNSGKPLAAIIAIVQIALAVFAWLVGSGVVKLKVPGLHIVATILSVILIVPFLNANSYKPEDKPSVLQWEEIILGDILPNPPSNKGRIVSNASDGLSVSISEVSEKQYDDYKKSCIEKGFDTDKNENGDNFTAYNKDGYKLRMYYSDYSKEITIYVDAPMEMKKIEWPSGTAGKMLPAPKSNIGNFSYEYDDHFHVYIGETSLQDYNNYVKACSDKGFTVDYQKGDNYYYADNNEGYHLSLNYEGNNIMCVEISAPDKTENTTETENSILTTKDETATEAPAASTAVTHETAPVKTTAPETDAPVISVGIRPEFKEAMDSYEAFYDEYIAFMKKYRTADAMEMLSMLSDYTDFMEKMDDWTDKLDKLEGDMNDEELAYYLEVTGRVEKKMLESIS